jgi:Membrane dipeptidase (Peptidase family M19)
MMNTCRRQSGRDTPIELVLEHFEHMLKQVGEDCVGFGSDFDGATVPAGIGDAAGLQNLVEIMRTRGYDEPLVEKLCFKNGLRVLGQTWGKTHSISRTNKCDASNSRESEAQELHPIIGSKQISDLSMSGLKEDTVSKKKTAKKKIKK